jgi:hypothetical protein
MDIKEWWKFKVVQNTLSSEYLSVRQNIRPAEYL